MSVMRVGSTKKFSDGWDKIFGGAKKPKKAAAGSKSVAKKKTAKKKAAKKRKGTKR